MRFSPALAILLQAHPIVSDVSVTIGQQQVANGDNDLHRYSSSLLSTILRTDRPQKYQQVSKSALSRVKSKFARSGRLKNEGKLRECDPRSTDVDVGVLSCDLDAVCMPHEQSTLGGICSPRLTAWMKLESGDTGVAECDPSSNDADIGILSCGNDEFCLQDSSATLGGICVKSTLTSTETSTEETIRHLSEGDTSRRGYIYCDARSPFYGMLDCDCDNFDLETNTGSFVCNYRYCFGEVSECCADTCASITLTYTTTGDEGDYSYETCYNFETPYEQSFCYGHNRNTLQGLSSCFGSFNGTSCDYCNSDTAYCTKFDCGNAGLGEAFCVEDFYPPILTNCYAECLACPICPDNPGHSVVNPTATVGFTGVTCGHLDYLGTTGFWGGARAEACADLVDAVKVDCCTPTSGSPTEETSMPLSSSVPESTTPPASPGSGTAPSISPVSSTSVPAPSDASPVSSGSVANEPTTSPVASSPVTNEPEMSIVEPIFPEDYEETKALPLMCTIRIQTARCKELLMAQSDVIPCGCKDRCIAFVNDQFEKCDDGKSIAGSGSIVAGCTFDMASEATFSCSDWENDSVSDSAYAKLSRHSSLILIVICLFGTLAATGMSS